MVIASQKTVKLNIKDKEASSVVTANDSHLKHIENSASESLIKTIKMKGLDIDIQLEIDEANYHIEARIIEGEEQSYDYCGSPPELDYYVVYDESGCDVTKNLAYPMIEHIEDELLEYYQNR